MKRNGLIYAVLIGLVMLLVATSPHPGKTVTALLFAVLVSIGVTYVLGGGLSWLGGTSLGQWLDERKRQRTQHRD